MNKDSKKNIFFFLEELVSWCLEESKEHVEDKFCYIRREDEKEILIQMRNKSTTLCAENDGDKNAQNTP